MRKTFGSHKQWRRQECDFEGLGDRHSTSVLHSPGKKLVYLAIAVLMLMIGLAGIIIPIIPGLLFLAAALFYLGKVSPGVKSWSDNHPILGRVNDRIDQMGDVKVWDRIKVAALMSVEAIASTLAAILTFGAGKYKRYKSESTIRK